MPITQDQTAANANYTRIFVEAENYRTDGVSHNYTQGHWMM